MSISDLVSVVVPVYNAEKYIDETINSILGQTYPAIEIIVVNDGSTDNTEIVLEKFFKLGNFQYIKIENSGGPSKPRNVGLDHSIGSCVFIFDADDLMYPEKIEESVRFFNLSKSHNIGIYFTDFIRIDTLSKPVGTPFLDGYQDFRDAERLSMGPGFYKMDRGVAWEVLIKDCYIGTSSVMLPKHVVEKGYRFDEEMKNGDDLDLWLRITREYDAGFVDKVLHGYRIHGGGLFETASSKRIIQRALILEKHSKFIASTGTKEKVILKIAKTWYAAGYYHQNIGEYSSAVKIYVEAFLKYRKYLLFRGVVVSTLKYFKSRWAGRSSN
jgi:glycosyltransferase involved in cell wall biosynthesis